MIEVGRYRVALVQPGDRQSKHQRCTECGRKEFTVGHWSIVVYEDGQPEKGLAIDPVPKCCNIEQPGVQLYDRRGDACHTLHLVVAHIEQTGSTDGLQLVELTHPVLPVPV